MTERLAKWFETQGADVAVAWHPGGHEIAQAEIAAIQRFLAPVAA
jgi:phospholipase/carboxylesterase